MTEPTPKTLLGPGPSNVHPRVYSAMSGPVLSHMDPDFWAIMDETVELLREVFQTGNGLTLPISGTGSAGMEAALYNSLEPGDTVVVGVAGFFASRIVEIAQRCEANVVPVEAEWGKAVSAAAVEEALAGHPETKVVALVHCETSTGVLQPLEEIGQLARAHGAMFLVDSVASLGGQRLPVDELGIDICYSGSQKSLSCPPGLAPITMSPRAVEAMKSRKTPCRSWYLDLSMLDEYWISGRKYHHTAPASMIYALRESLRILVEEGLENSFARHQLNADALRAGVDAMGLSIVADEEVRSNTVNGVRMPDGSGRQRRAHGPAEGTQHRDRGRTRAVRGESGKGRADGLFLAGIQRVVGPLCPSAGAKRLGLRGCGLGGSGGGESGLRRGVLARLLFLPVRLVQ